MLLLITGCKNSNKPTYFIVKINIRHILILLYDIAKNVFTLQLERTYLVLIK